MPLPSGVEPDIPDWITDPEDRAEYAQRMADAPGSEAERRTLEHIERLNRSHADRAHRRAADRAQLLAGSGWGPDTRHERRWRWRSRTLRPIGRRRGAGRPRIRVAAARSSARSGDSGSDGPGGEASGDPAAWVAQLGVLGSVRVSVLTYGVEAPERWGLE
jgi:hypothetical protein